MTSLMLDIYIMLIFATVLFANMAKYDWQKKDNSGLPWMLTCKEDVQHEFEVLLDSVAEAENDRNWSCLMGQMKNIEDEDGDSVADDGEHEIPFWAKNGFIDCSVSVKIKKGWAKMTYTRSKAKNGNNEADFQ